MTITTNSPFCFIGLAFSAPMSGNDATFWKFQANQFILLIIYGFVAMLIGMFLAFIPLIGWLISIALNIFGLILFVMLIINVVNKKMTPLPVIGKLFTIIK